MLKDSRTKKYKGAEEDTTVKSRRTLVSARRLTSRNHPTLMVHIKPNKTLSRIHTTDRKSTTY